MMPRLIVISCALAAQSEGMINFNSDWKCDGPARIFSSSYFANECRKLCCC